MFNLSMLETLLLALIVLGIGHFLNSKIPFLRRNNLPEPVVGGLLFALLMFPLAFWGKVTVNFDMSLKTPFMLCFFTTVGLGANFRLLAKGGPKVFLFLLICTGLLIIQDGTGVLLSYIFDLNPLVGLLSSSITLSGGHGTGATYAAMFAENRNLMGAMEMGMAAATFGLILGGLIGGPVARRLIEKRSLQSGEKRRGPNATGDRAEVIFDVDETDVVTPRRMLETILIILFCVVVGGFFHKLFLNMGIPLPSFICPLMLGIGITNILDRTPFYSVSRECVDLWGTMSLSLFLAMSLMDLRLHDLLSLAAPLLIILAIQTVIMALFAYYVTFRFMGQDYTAAIIAGGHCGFGMGATPTAVANMESLVSRYGPAREAFLIVPVVGAFFIDICNTLVLQVFLWFPFVD